MIREWLFALVTFALLFVEASSANGKAITVLTYCYALEGARAFLAAPHLTVIAEICACAVSMCNAQSFDRRLDY